MDCIKVGRLIYSLRKEKGLTQKELAEALFISDRTISKWERGIGCPDISLLSNLSDFLGVDIARILSGHLDENEDQNGNMKKTKFYCCPVCGNTMFAGSEAEISCCGRKLKPLEAHSEDAAHTLNVTEIENDYYLHFDHEMTKQHYISFIAYVTWDSVLFIKLYPEQAGEVRFPRNHRGDLYYYCTEHGLIKKQHTNPRQAQK